MLIWGGNPVLFTIVAKKELHRISSGAAVKFHYPKPIDQMSFHDLEVE